MGPPLAFLLGLAVVFSVREFASPVTGSGTVVGLAPFVPLLFVPSLLAYAAWRGARGQLLTGRRAIAPPRALLRLSWVASPLVCYAVLGPGGFADLGARLAASSHLVDVGLLLTPLLLAEGPRQAIATMAEAHLEFLDSLAPSRVIDEGSLPRWSDVRPTLRTKLAWPLLMSMPCVAFGVGLDLLQRDRELHMFVLGTSPGIVFGTLAFLAVAALLLPAWFRIAFGVVRTLPEPVGSHLRRTAETLGFHASRVLQLPTGNRAMNAMLVGPLPFGRFLCLTDGILATLDPESLAGVVAHEIGHSKRSHPLILMALAVALPLLLPAPLALVDLPTLDVTTQALLAIGGLVIVLSIVRTLAHRFEHEADAASVDALGSGPCTRALMVVSRLAVPVSHGFFRRLASLHPEESSRFTFMRRYENEPEYRRRFVANGRRLRIVAVIVLVLASIGAAIAWRIEWPFEKALWRFHCGDFRGAAKLANDIGDDVPERWREPWTRFRDELAVAVQLAPDADDWSAAKAGIEAKAFDRGSEVLRAQGPMAAAPWFALLEEVDDRPVIGAIHDFCRATDDARREESRRVVRRLGVPPGLEKVFGD